MRPSVRCWSLRDWRAREFALLAGAVRCKARASRAAREVCAVDGSRCAAHASGGWVQLALRGVV